VGVLVGVAVWVGVKVAVGVNVGVMVVGGTAEKLTRAFALPLVCFILRYKSAFALSKYQLDPVADSKALNELTGETTAPLTWTCPGLAVVFVNRRTSEPAAFSNVRDNDLFPAFQLEEVMPFVMILV